MSTSIIRISAGIIGLFVFLLCAVPTQAATLNTSPSTVTTTVGRTFTIQVLLDTSGQSVNAVDGQITFSNDTLKLVGISKNGILNLWAQDPTYSNAAGTASFQGVVLNGYTGNAGTVASLTFEAIAQGTGSVEISDSSSSALLNDGSGTDVLSGTTGASIAIGPAVAKETPAPVQQNPISVAPVASPSVNTVPVFTAYNNPIIPDSLIAVKGSATPNTTLTITFTDNGQNGTAKVSQSQVTVNNAGQFAFVSDGMAMEGHTYSIVAATTDGKNTKPLVLSVKNSLWFKIKLLIITFIFIKVSILLLLLFILISLYLLHRSVVLKKRLTSLEKHLQK